MMRRSPSKVVVRTHSGGVVPGFAAAEHIREQVKIVTRQGNEEIFELKDLKAVFFVKDFTGNPGREDLKFFTRHPVSERVWVKVALLDGEILEGAVKNDRELLVAQGFYLWPSDEDCNNELVYVPKSAVTVFAILWTE